ncbi:MAG: DUF4430 domain-containing protein [Clostridia bacterium]|nr:DUF4430 domain-containing protein [Clostridia bacterium]
MKMTSIKKILSLLLCVVLIAVVALFATGCGAEKPETSPETTTKVEATLPSADDGESAPVKMGQGEKQFTFKVTDPEGTVTVFEINTDKVTVGEALIELELIQGEDGPYGLYVKTVNGVTVDYDKDGKYWAFYANGEYASKGVELTDITDGTVYEFKAE